MTAEQFKVGDIVELKSGGAQMIIFSFASNNEFVICKWHDKYHRPHQDNFPKSALKKVV